MTFRKIIVDFLNYNRGLLEKKGGAFKGIFARKAWFLFRTKVVFILPSNKIWVLTSKPTSLDYQTRLLVSDSVFVKINQNNYKYWDSNAVYQTRPNPTIEIRWLLRHKTNTCHKLFPILRNIFRNVENKYICQFGQIHLAIWTNTKVNLPAACSFEPQDWKRRTTIVP